MKYLLNICLIIVSNNLFSQTYNFKWHEIYGQTYHNSQLSNLVEISDNRIYYNASFESTSGSGLTYEIPARTGSENILNLKTKKIEWHKDARYRDYSGAKLNLNSQDFLFEISGSILGYIPGRDNNSISITPPAAPYNINSYNSYFSDIIEDSSGLFHAIGYSVKVDSNNVGNFDILYVQVNRLGQILETKSFGSNASEVITSFLKTGENEFICTGKKEVSPNNYDLYICKINVKNKAIIWERTLGGIDNEYGKEIIKNNNGSFFVHGKSMMWGQNFMDNYGKDLWIINIDSNGNQLWSKFFQTGLYSEFNDIILVNPNELIAVGYSYNNGNDFEYNFGQGSNNSTVVTISSSGSLLNKSFFNSTTNSAFSKINKIIKTKDNRLLVGGYTYGGGDYSDGVAKNWDTHLYHMFIGEIDANVQKEIVVNNLSKRVVCSDSTLNISFQSIGDNNPGDLYRIELSNENGEFDNPIILTTVNNPGTYSVTIPYNIPKSPYYFLRVVCNDANQTKSVNKRIEVISNFSKVNLLPQVYNENFISGSRIDVAMTFEGFGPFDIKFSDGSVNNTIFDSVASFSKVISSQGVYKIVELKNPCGVSDLINGEVFIKGIKNYCIPNSYDNTSRLNKVEFRKNSSLLDLISNSIERPLLNTGLYLPRFNFVSGDTIKLNLGFSTTAYHKIYIDFNNDEIFSENELINESSVSEIENLERNFQYFINSSTPLGRKSLRVCSFRSSMSNSCQGNCVDYLIDILPNPIPTITNATLAANTNYICVDSPNQINLTTSGVFNNDNVFSLEIKDALGKVVWPISGGQSSNLIIPFTILYNLSIYSPISIKVKSSSPEVSFSLPGSFILNRKPIVKITNNLKLSGDYVVYEMVPISKNNYLPINFKTNTNQTGIIEDTQTYIEFVNNLLIDTLKITEVSNQCGIGTALGTLLLRRVSASQFKVELSEYPSFQSSVSTKSNFLLNKYSNISEPVKFTFDSLKNALNLKISYPNYGNGSCIVRLNGPKNAIIKVPELTGNYFTLDSNFLKKEGKYFLQVDFFTEKHFENLYFSNSREFSIKKTVEPCEVQFNACYFNSTHFINNIEVFDINSEPKLAHYSSGCSPGYYMTYPTLYESNNNLVFEKSRTYLLNVTSGGNDTYQHLFVAIDFNNNGSFEENEKVFSSNSNHLLIDSLSGQFSLPDNIASGNYIMRVISRKSNSSGDFLTNSSFCTEDPWNTGEIIDFAIKISDFICPDILTKTSPISGIKFYEANNSISLKSILQNNSKVSIDAGRQILLEPGFETKANVIFKAFLDGCGNN
ncbi:MAG: GEVED domain-containing protein [Spirosomataceae bacterium]